MKNVLIITTKVLSYRSDFFDLLNESVNLTVLHSGNFTEPRSYKLINAQVKRFKGFYRYNNQQSIIENGNFDVIICIFDLRYYGTYELAWSRLKHKTVFWGIGISSSSGLREKRLMDKLRVKIAKQARSLILYSEKVKKVYQSLNFPKPIYVATNSVKVAQRESYSLKQVKPLQFLFVGSLDERKRIDLFLKAFARTTQQLPNFSGEIHIIGSGSLESDLKNLTDQLAINSSVQFHGRISDPDQLTQFYEKAILSFTINQAGLSVLQSLGNGVPVLSSEDAVTGGELFNIIDGKTGFLIGSGSDEHKIVAIQKILEDIHLDPTSVTNMRQSCREHYVNHASLENMRNVFMKCINTI
jgi:glycosyltransferase involved in cell wall biosynthesis